MASEHDLVFAGGGNGGAWRWWKCAPAAVLIVVPSSLPVKAAASDDTPRLYWLELPTVTWIKVPAGDQCLGSKGGRFSLGCKFCGAIHGNIHIAAIRIHLFHRTSYASRKMTGASLMSFPPGGHQRKDCGYWWCWQLYLLPPNAAGFCQPDRYCPSVKFYIFQLARGPGAQVGDHTQRAHIDIVRNCHPHSSAIPGCHGCIIHRNGKVGIISPQTSGVQRSRRCACGDKQENMAMVNNPLSSYCNRFNVCATHYLKRQNFVVQQKGRAAGPRFELHI